MNRWTHVYNSSSDSAMIFEVSPLGSRTASIAVCFGTKNAPLIAACPELLETMRELLSAYQSERNGLEDLAENAFEDKDSKSEIYEQISVMDQLIRKAQNAIATAEGKDPYTNIKTD